MSQFIDNAWLDDVSRKAQENMDKWGVQPIDQIALAIAEESGEIAQAVLQHQHEDASVERVRDEAMDLAPLCIQMLVSLREIHGVGSSQMEML